MINMREENIDFEIPPAIESSSWINALSGEQHVLESMQNLVGYKYILFKK